MERRFDTVIVGGGLNGGALALALARSGLDVALVEPVPAQARAAQGFDGRAYALALAAQRMLGALGLWDGLRGQAEAIREVKVSDARPGEPPAPFVLEMDQAEIDEGPLGFMLEDRFLRPALLDAIDGEARVTQIDGRVTDHAPGAAGVAVTLESGEVLRAALVVACDGRNSAVAARAGIRRVTRDYGQSALVCAVAHEQPHGGVAHQMFLPPGPLAILPLPENRSAIVWTESGARAAQIQAMDEAGYLDVLRPLFGDFLGEIRLDGKRWSYPLSLSLAHEFIAPRLALVGDAAHGLHPVAGQGLNAGLRDVAALAEVLTEARRRGEDIGQADVLARYQEWRRFDATALALATDAFARLFSNDNALLRLGRDIGMGLVNALPGVKRGLIREAAGLTGEVPLLMQGRAL